MVRIAVGMVSFNSMPFIKGAIETMTPYAEQILVADGPVRYWQDRGHTTSTDGSLDFLRKRVTLIEGQWREKDEQHRSYLDLIRDDITHLWIVDPDEIYHDCDIRFIRPLLDDYDLVRFCQLRFVGGLDSYVELREAATRILRWESGAELITSRPPTLSTAPERILAGKELARLGIYMYHYSHVLPHQIERRKAYSNHTGHYQHQFVAEPFRGAHPKWIEDNRSWLMQYDSKSC